jgi:hypothetical protein
MSLGYFVNLLAIGGSLKVIKASLYKEQGDEMNRVI